MGMLGIIIWVGDIIPDTMPTGVGEVMPVIGVKPKPWFWPWDDCGQSFISTLVRFL